MTDHENWKPPTSGAGEPGSTPPPVPPPAATPPADDMPPPAGAPAHGEATVVDDASTPKNKSKGIVALIAVAVIAVGIAGIFAVRGMTGSAAGGAETPEALGEEFLDALEGRDLIGLVDLMLPGERDTLAEPFIEGVAELRRLEVLSSDFSLSDIAFATVSLSDRAVDVESTNVDDIVHISVAADAAITLDGEHVPFGDLITQYVPDDTLTEIRGTRVTETDTLDMTFVAVEEDGRWYVSLWYSAAEAIRNDAGVDRIPVDGVGARGAESPEAVFDELVERSLRLDLRGIIQLLDPYEASALQRYAPTFLSDIDDEIAMVQDELDELLDAVQVEQEWRIEGSGSSRTAFLESAAIEMDVEGMPFRVEYDGDCVRLEGDTHEFGLEIDDTEFCAGDSMGLDELDELDLPHEVTELLEAIVDAFDDLEPIGVEVRERDGEWYLAPLATTSEAGLKMLRALDRDEIDRIVDAGVDSFEAFFTVFEEFESSAGGMFGLDDDWFDDDPVEWLEGPDDDFESALDDDGEWPDLDDLDDLDDFDVAGPGDVTACYMESDLDDAIACFDAAIETGDATDMDVPAVLRYPECGLAEAYWTGALFSMSDADFTDVVLAAKPCYDALLESEELTEWEVPFEAVDPECFEGRNVYTVDDDDEYEDRVFDCLYDF